MSSFDAIILDLTSANSSCSIIYILIFKLLNPVGGRFSHEELAKKLGILITIIKEEFKDFLE